ncbi:hypothetical protein PTKIN_Ptkin07bG0299300 [Pterospermum kingtungense]
MENCQRVESTTVLYKPCLEDNSVGVGDGGCGDVCNGSDSLNRDSLRGVEFMSVDQCQKIPEMDDSQLVGNADVAVRGHGGATAETGAGNGVKVVDVSAVKRRRGRPPRNQAGTVSSLAPPPQRKKKDEEDVCFICFDGGSLVLCDRRGCPKAYHPSCIKRDEAFFKSKAKWNCGWHICSTCQKASYYMCYTCTYSLCKNCTKDADYVNVRGNKGFCGECMRAIMLIENITIGNKETVQVDFDDQTSWEYLFKVYWILLKEKLSLSIDELIKAKNPWKEIAIMGPKGESSGEFNNYSNAKGANVDRSFGDLGASYSKRRKTTKQQKFLNQVEYREAEKSAVMKGTPLPEGTNWATKDLLEFVAHMKNGDISVLSRFDVQGLFLDYITRSNLRDPHQKSHIVCDSRLTKLFGKARVGHFEMLKLLESHFLIQDHSRAIDTIRDGGIGDSATQLAVDGNKDSQPIIANDRRRKTRKKVDEKGKKANPDEFAAVDVHNMNLIYLKRSSMENLIDDTDKFSDKVFGSFVRISIPGNDQKQDAYRLVQVVGTRKVAEPYKIGERTTDLMLEILNIDKKQVVSIDGISNQDFSEDECQQLCQSIKCGSIKWFTVGEIQEKAMALQSVRVNDWLESEILRVKNLRDRASEKGHAKEYPLLLDVTLIFKECVAKLQLLSSPDERQRRLLEIPEVHSDQNMNLHRKSEEVSGKLDEKKKENNMKLRSGFGMKEQEHTSPLKGGDVMSDIGSRETSIPPHSTEMEQSLNNTETDKIWHYQDPLGNIHGPFPMAILRRWSMSGHFPPDFRIWRANKNQQDSILLADALADALCGRYSQPQQFIHNSCVPIEDARINSNDGCQNRDGDVRASRDLNVNKMESKQVEGSLNSVQNDTSGHGCGNSESAKSIELGSQASPCMATVDIVNSSAVHMASPLPHWDSEKGDKYFPGQPQVSGSLPSSTVSGKPCETQSHQVSGGHGVEKWDCSSINMNENLNKTSEGNTIAGSVKQDDSEEKSGKSCGQSWRSPPLVDASNGWDPNSGLISLARALEASENNQDIDFSDIPTSTSRLNHEDSKVQTSKNEQSPLNVPHQDSGPSWSTASSLVGNGPQLPELAGEWGGYSSTPAKPSAEEWESDLVLESSLKRTDLGSDHAATPTSGSGQLTHCSARDPANNASDWDPIVPEPNEYSLGDESVSDLLAEVEAMESLHGLASPTSILRCDGDLAQGSEPDCFSPVGGLSPAPDPGKSDAFSSTNDLQMPSQSTVTNETFGVSHSEVLDPQRSSGGHSSTSASMDEDKRPGDVSVNQYESGSDMQPPATSVTTWGMATVDTAWRAGPETTSTNWGAAQGNQSFNWGGLHQAATTNVSWGTGQATFHEHNSIHSGTSGGNNNNYYNPHYWGSQHRYVSPRDRDFQGRDSSFGRGRSSSWNNRHSYYGGGGGGSPNGVASFRHPPKGQRVCMETESNSFLTPTQRYAAATLFAIAVNQAQIHQTRPLGLPTEEYYDDAPCEERTSSGSSSDSVSEDPDLWVHENSGLLRPVFRFLHIDSSAWSGIEETAGSSPASHHVGSFLRLLAEEGGEGSSEAMDLDKEVLSKSVDTMALDMETNSESSQVKKQKHREFEHEYREKYATEVPSESVVANPQESNTNVLHGDDEIHLLGDSFDDEPAEEVMMLSYKTKVTVLYELLSACLAAADTHEDNKKLTRRRRGYDARHRVALRLLATWFDIEWIKMEAVEMMVAYSAMALAKEKEAKEEESQSSDNKWSKWKRRGIIGAAAITGGTLMAVTGGLAAPAIAAGFGALAPTLGTLIPVIGASGFAAAASAAGTVAGSVAVAASFGAAGAGLTGTKMARRIGSVNEFEFKAIGDHRTQGRLAVEIMISGFIFDKEDFIRPWEGRIDNMERFVLQWESKNLIAVSTAIQDWLTSRVAMELMRRGAMMTVLGSLLTALAWPATLLAATDFIDSTWSIAVDRTDKAGKLLAEVLLKGYQGNRPVTLIGYSLGARAIFKCLQVLSETEQNAELVERVVLLGAPISIKAENWGAVRKMVAGRFINAYSSNDWMLGVAFRASLFTQGLAGIQPVDAQGIENVNVTDLIEGHSSYLWCTQQILDRLELDVYYPIYKTTLPDPDEDE